VSTNDQDSAAISSRRAFLIASALAGVGVVVGERIVQAADAVDGAEVPDANDASEDDLDAAEDPEPVDGSETSELEPTAEEYDPEAMSCLCTCETIRSSQEDDNAAWLLLPVGAAMLAVKR